MSYFTYHRAAFEVICSKASFSYFGVLLSRLVMHMCVCISIALSPHLRAT